MAQIILDSNNNLIQGDFDNATINNRTKFKTTTTNATTNVYAVPNGSATSAGFTVTNAADPTNASKLTIATNGSTDTQIISGVNGSGTYLPMSFYVNNTLAMQISTAGVVSAAGGFAGAGPTLKFVTDSTDITLASIASSYNNVGSTFSVTIPTTGYIKIASTYMRLQTAIADAANVVFGLRIGSTNYWFGKYSRNSSIGYVAFISDQSSIGNYADFFGTSVNTSYPSGYQSGSSSLIDIAGNSVPTGTQTVQLIAAYYSGQSGGGVLKGTAVTTKVGIEFVSAS